MMLELMSIRENVLTNITKKMSAINEGYLYLSNLMIQRGKGLQELVSSSTDIEATVGTNKVSLPSDFNRLHTLYYKSGSDNYLPFSKDQIQDFELFLQTIGQNFYDSDVTGTAALASVLEPYIYTNTYFSNYDKFTLTSVVGTFVVGETVTGGTSEATATIASVTATSMTITQSTISGTFEADEAITGGTSLATATISALSETDGLKIIYHKKPAKLVAYDKLNLTSIVGTFVSGETITGSTSSATATVLAVSATYLTYTSVSLNGTFHDAETITGSTSSATATTDETASSKPQETEVSDKYKSLLANAGAAYYLYMGDSEEANAKNQTLEDFVSQRIKVDLNKASYKFGLGS
jgi:hypothetical protein